MDLDLLRENAAAMSREPLREMPALKGRWPSKRVPVNPLTPADKRRHPWATGALKIKPVGLRERVLRVAYMYLEDVKQILRNHPQGDLRAICEWRLQQPTQFAELCAVLGIDLPKTRTYPLREQTA